MIPSAPLTRAKDKVRLGIATLRNIRAGVPTSRHEMKEALDTLYRALDLIEEAERLQEAPRADRAP